MNNGNNELTSEIIFTGEDPVPAGTRGAFAFINELRSRKTKLGWTEERTMDYVQSALRGPAADWYFKGLKVQLGLDEWQRMQTNFTEVFLTVFEQQYCVDLGTKASVPVFDLAPQRKGETAKAFVSRLFNNLAPLLNRDEDEEVIELPPLSDAAQEALDTPALRAEVQARVDSMEGKADARACNRIIRILVRALLRQGLRDDNVRYLLSELKHKAQPKDYFEKINSRDTAVAHMNRVNGHFKKVASLEDEEDELLQLLEDDEIDAVQNKKKNGNGSGAKSKAFCNFCKRRGHATADCRNKKKHEREMAEKKKASAKATNAVMAESAAAVLGSLNNITQLPGNETGFW